MGLSWDDAAAFPLFDNRVVVSSRSSRPFSPAFQVPNAHSEAWDDVRHASVMARAGVVRAGNLCFQNHLAAGGGGRLFLSDGAHAGQEVADRFFPLGSDMAALWTPNLSRVGQLSMLAEALPVAVADALAGPRRVPGVGEFFVKSGQESRCGGRSVAVAVAERAFAGLSDVVEGEFAGRFAGEVGVDRVEAVVPAVAAGGGLAAREAMVSLAFGMIMSDCVVVMVPLGDGERPVAPVRLGLFQCQFRLALVTGDGRYAGVVAEGAAVFFFF